MALYFGSERSIMMHLKKTQLDDRIYDLKFVHCHLVDDRI